MSLKTVLKKRWVVCCGALALVGLSLYFYFVSIEDGIEVSSRENCDQINSQIEHPVLIYTRKGCGFCKKAKHLLLGKQVRYHEIDVGVDPEAYRVMTASSFGSKTVPQVFIFGQHVGGFTDLVRLENKGELDKILNPAILCTTGVVKKTYN